MCTKRLPISWLVGVLRFRAFFQNTNPVRLFVYKKNLSRDRVRVEKEKITGTLENMRSSLN